MCLAEGEGPQPRNRSHGTRGDALKTRQIRARRGGGLSARFLNRVFTPRHCPRDTVSPLRAGVFKTGSELHFGLIHTAV